MLRLGVLFLYTVTSKDSLLLTLFRLGEGVGMFRATLRLKSLLLANDCVYSVATS